MLAALGPHRLEEFGIYALLVLGIANISYCRPGPSRELAQLRIFVGLLNGPGVASYLRHGKLDSIERRMEQGTI